jgi:hypothetical protein
VHWITGSPSQAADEEHDGSDIEEGPGWGECRLGILPDPAVAARPGEEPFNNPAARVHRKTDQIGRLLDDLNHDQGGA